MTTVLIPLIDGFEEIEAVTSIDLLRRAGVHVTTAGIGKRTATGSHDITVETDSVLDDELARAFDLILLPGGPGTRQLRQHEPLKNMVRLHHEAGRPLAAICAAPTFLADLGILDGVPATCFPKAEADMAGALLRHDPVVRHGPLVTSRGAGTAVPFALAVIELLLGTSKAQEIAQSIVYASFESAEPS